jgi:hypothetical protein
LPRSYYYCPTASLGGKAGFGNLAVQEKTAYHVTFLPNAEKLHQAALRRTEVNNKE